MVSVSWDIIIVFFIILVFVVHKGRELYKYFRHKNEKI